VSSVAYVAYVAPQGYEVGKRKGGCSMSGYLRRSNYLRIVERAKSEEVPPAAPVQRRQVATKATEATKASAGVGVRTESRRDISDERSSSFAPLTVSEVLAEMGRWGTGARKNAELYRRGELSEEKAVEYVTCAILAGRRASFARWRRHAPAVRKALSLCVHELEPKACKVCARNAMENQGEVAGGKAKGGQWT
jgi:hypothetical protein